MSDDPNPLSDVRRGLGLLLRAARTAARKWPTTDLEGVVATSAREVGRAIENVAVTLEREVFGKGASSKSAPPRSTDETKESGKPGAPGDGASKGEASEKDPRD